MTTLADALAIGVQHHQAGRLQDAEEAYRQIIAVHANQPAVFLAYFNLGLALETQGHLDEAALCYEHALRLEPRFVEAYKTLGNTLKSQGRLADAIACYQQALERKPDDAAIYNNLGITLDEQGRFVEATAC
jgi:tetratricopeptide (TPR) repeat protein